MLFRSFPIFSGATSYFGSTDFSGDINVELECYTIPATLKLYINGVQVDCKDIITPGLQTIIFSGVMINPTDYVEIILAPGAC